jgi:hypothetical protein
VALAVLQLPREIPLMAKYDYCDIFYSVRAPYITVSAKQQM